MAVRFDMTISFGNLLSICTIIVMVAAGYATLKTDQAALARRTDRLEAGAEGRETRLRAVELLQAGQASDLRNIQIGISEIKAQLDRMSGGR